MALRKDPESSVGWGTVVRTGTYHTKKTGFILSAVPLGQAGRKHSRADPASGDLGGARAKEMVVKRGPPSTVSLKFHIPVVLGAECCFLTPGQWARASLSSGGAISFLASGHAATILCSGIDPLYSIVRDDNVTVNRLLVRSCSMPASIAPPQRPSAVAVTAAPGAPSPAPADLWVEVNVAGVRPNSCISSTPTLLPAWRLLLPRLVTYTLEEAPQRIARPPAAAEDGGRAAQAQEGDKVGSTPGVNGGHKKVSEARALEAVYASLKPTSSRLGFEEEGAEGAAGVGRAPRASGLNAVPSAVVMKGAT